MLAPALDVTVPSRLWALLRGRLVRDGDLSMVVVSHDLGVVADTAGRGAVQYPVGWP